MKTHKIWYVVVFCLVVILAGCGASQKSVDALSTQVAELAQATRVCGTVYPTPQPTAIGATVTPQPTATPEPTATNEPKEDCWFYAIPEDSVTWSQGSSLLVQPNVEIRAEGERWIENPSGSGKWSFSHMVEYQIPAWSKAQYVNLEKSRAKQHDFYNDATKIIWWCVANTQQDGVAATMFENDPPSGWSLELFYNGRVELQQNAGSYSSMLSKTTEYLLP